MIPQNIKHNFAISKIEEQVGTSMKYEQNYHYIIHCIVVQYIVLCNKECRLSAVLKTRFSIFGKHDFSLPEKNITCQCIMI